MSESPIFVTSPDFERIRQGDMAAVADGMRAIFDGLNQEIMTRAQIVSPWKEVPFNAANFLADGGTWTVAENQVYDLKYLKFGTLVILQFGFGRPSAGTDATALSPATGLSTIAIRIPELRAKPSRKGNDFTGASNGFIVNDNGGVKAGWAFITPIWNLADEPGCVLWLELSEGTDYDATLPQGLSLFGVVVFEIEG